MSIVLNEYQWAERMIELGEFGDSAYETLCRVAKYYKANGMGRKEIRKKLEEFLLRCDQYASITLWDNTLEKAVKVGLKYDLVMIDKIVVTKPEMETILSIKGVQLQRLAFTLLCIAKYMMAVAPQTNGWVNTTEGDVMKMACFRTSYKRINLMYGQLLDAGLLQASKKISNLNVRVLFMKDGEAALDVTDFRDLGNQFMKYIGKPYFVCQNCGLTVKVPDGAKPGNMKYCHDCALKVQVRQNVNSVMRGRMASHKNVVSFSQC